MEDRDCFCYFASKPSINGDDADAISFFTAIADDSSPIGKVTRDRVLLVSHAHGRKGGCSRAPSALSFSPSAAYSNVLIMHNKRDRLFGDDDECYYNKKH